MSGAKEVDVERQLRLAAATAAWPVTPDLRSAVLARLEAPGGSVAAGAPVPVAAHRRARLRPIAAFAVALLALLVLAGVAGALGFRLPGLDIVLVGRLPSAGTNLVESPPAGSGLDLGSPIPLAEARALDGPRVLVPSTMPEPDVAYVLGTGGRRIVTLAWRAESGQRTIPDSDLSLSLMALRGDTGDDLVKKLVAPETTIEPAMVGGDRGWWIAGAPHEIIVRLPGGDVDVVTSALAGDTLLFARNGTLYRLESAFGRDATIAIAESLR